MGWSGPVGEQLRLAAEFASDPRISPEDKAKGNLTNSRAIIDACRPFHWKDEFPHVNAPPPDMAREAREKWGYLCD